MTQRERIIKVIRQLDKLKNEYPDTEIFIEIPGGSARCKIGDAIIFESMDNAISIDAE